MDNSIPSGGAGSPLERVLDRLGIFPNGKTEYEAHCPGPVHGRGDRSPSLSVGQGDDGRVLLCCHAGCTVEQVVAALGLNMSDLFVRSLGSNGSQHIVAVYDYTDALGDLLFQVCRLGPRKDFRQRSADGTPNVKGIPKPLPLFRLPEVIWARDNGKAIAVCEGEHDAEVLNRLGTTFAVATTCPMGAGKWKPEHANTVAGAERVAVLAHDDPAGRSHAADVALSLYGRVDDLRVFLPVEGCNDVADHLRHHKLKELRPVDEATWRGWSTPNVNQAIPRQPLSLADLLTHEDEEYDWLIDGLLERGDRVVLTGKEGEGKSTLLRQIGIAAAAGVHPFTLEPIHPLRVLDIDCENSQRQLRREFAKALIPLAQDDGMADLLARFFVEVHTEGLVLDLARDPDGDRAWLEGTIAGCQPELVILGPVYKLIGGDANDEEPNRELVKLLDRLRVRYGFAILLEAHTPHDAKRPYGWSGWKRWPEFGLHLDAGGEVARWRGDRDARDWPERLTKGVPDGWLWTMGGTAVWEPAPDSRELQIVDAELEVLRAMRRADKPLTKSEVLERVSRRKAVATVAFNRLRDQKAFVVTTEDRPRVNGRPQPVELFAIDPKGPYAADG